MCNDDDKGIELYQSRTFIGGNIDNDRRLALEIEVKDSLLELKLNNKSLGIGQFKIEFYEYNNDNLLRKLQSVVQRLHQNKSQ